MYEKDDHMDASIPFVGKGFPQIGTEGPEVDEDTKPTASSVIVVLNVSMHVCRRKRSFSPVINDFF